MIFDIKKSVNKIVSEKITVIAKIAKVVVYVSFREGKYSFLNSSIESLKKLTTILKYFIWQEREESNPQPTVLETATLPVELRS
jgi:hypothetical protein